MNKLVTTLDCNPVDISYYIPTERTFNNTSNNQSRYSSSYSINYSSHQQMNQSISKLLDYQSKKSMSINSIKTSSSSSLPIPIFLSKQMRKIEEQLEIDRYVYLIKTLEMKILINKHKDNSNITYDSNSSDNETDKEDNDEDDNRLTSKIDNKMDCKSNSTEDDSDLMFEMDL
mmetsp:Transcript_21128/g.19245  ORF Transcript_21128/g.19245 Transcript_21128/m.19245 type:complete len:173 (-) Transcript_21128:168-686(-)